MGKCLIWKVTLFIVAILFVSGCVQHSRLEKHEEQGNFPDKPGFPPSPSKPVPKKYMEYRNFPGAERFGFVCMDLLAIQDLNLGWVRPHPGPFIWGKIEPAKGKYDFSQADEVVRKAQAMNLNILANHLAICKMGSGKVGKEFVKILVERYDGDGVDDMPGLKKPVKYWEIINLFGMLQQLGVIQVF